LHQLARALRDALLWLLVEGTQRGDRTVALHFDDAPLLHGDEYAGKLDGMPYGSRSTGPFASVQ